MRRKFLFLTLSLLLICVAGCASTKENSSSKSQPNILLILADDAGYADFGFQGSQQMETPNLDQLANNGIIFTDAHVSATVCSPSRAGLMTGRYQQRFGHEANSPPSGKGMDTTEATLAQVLSKHGYKTGIIGKWHLGDTEQYHPNSRGFDEFYGLLAGGRSYFPANYDSTDPHAIIRNREYVGFDDGYLTDRLGKEMASFIDRNHDQPFFGFLSFTAPHGPMEATKEDLDRFKGHPRQTLAAMTWAMDRAVGKVINKLEEHELLENTLIFFLSDNGGAYFNNSSNEPLKGWKGNKFEGGHRVPFFIHWKGNIKGGQSFDGLTSSLDIFPTAMAAAGIDTTTGKQFDGVNLLPYLEDSERGPPHQQLFFQKEEEAAMRDGKWKLIHLEDYGYAMYDLKENLGETNNLVESRPNKFEEMKQDLQAWQQQLVEPWWHESKQWRDVTWGIHKALMNNEKPAKVRP